MRMLRFVAILLLALRSTALTQDAVLGGTVVTPNKVLSKAWVIIRNGRIAAISQKPPLVPTGPVVETGGIIFPGFIDLHNHPLYSVFERWQPTTKFKNRYEWRELQQYKDLVGIPGAELQRKDEQTFCDLDEYAEVKALIGGTTSITGISPRLEMSPPIPTCVTGLARNLDWASGFHGRTVGKERIKNAFSIAPLYMTQTDEANLRQELKKNEIDLLLIHVAEGSPLDLESSVEFLALKGRRLLGSHTAVIHGTALAAGDFRQMHRAGAALVWSPRSNMELYGVTTNIPAALKEKVTVSLAPDWSPTGSTNMLAELKYASRFSHEQLSNQLTDGELFRMSTAVPARIAHISDRVGSIQIHRYADLFVLKGDASQPFAALANARPEDVQLVLVGGVPLYGSERLMRGFDVRSEAVDVCGSRMLLNSAALPGTFAEVQRRLEEDLKTYDLRLAPLAECRP